MDDNELMLKVRDGSKEAYEILIQKYMTRAKAFALSYVHDSYAAEDIAQESFVDIYLQRFWFDQSYQFSTWLYTILRNKSLNYLKKNREMSMSSFLNTTEISLPEKNLVDTDTPESAYFQKTEYLELLAEIQKLKEDERNILYLYAAREYSYKEIAKTLGKSVAQVKITLFRARKKLKEAGSSLKEQRNCHTGQKGKGGDRA